MKGKKLLSLVSLLAGAAIVGTTFAAWAVTDKADPFGIKVSPGSIEPEKTKYVTLEYGEQEYADIQNIKAGEERLGAEVGLKATTSDNTAYTGKFNLSLINQTQKTGDSPKYLINYLEVDVYQDEVVEDSDGLALPYNMVKDESINSPETFAASLSLNGKVYKVVDTVYTSVTEYAAETEYFIRGEKFASIGHVPVTAEVQDKFTTNINIKVASGAEKVVWVVVKLSATADASVMPEIESDIVYLQMNWNSNGDDIQTRTIYSHYTTALGENQGMYCYAWKGDSVNAKFPGKEMVNVTGNYYSYDINPSSFDKCLFVVYNSLTGAEIAKSEDITIANVDFVKKPTYKFGNPSSWEAAPVIDPTLEDPYYVVGDHKGNWAPAAEFGLKLVEGTTDEYVSGDLSFIVGEAFKVTDKARDNWYTDQTTDWSEYFELDTASDNLIVKKAGVYNVHLDLTPTDNNYIYFTIAGDQPITEFAWGIAGSNSAWKLDPNRLFVDVTPDTKENGDPIFVYEIASVSFTKDELWKVTNTENEWIYNNDNCGLDTDESTGFTVDEDGNIKVGSTGNYKVTLNIFEGSAKDQYGNFYSGMQIIVKPVVK